VTVVRRFELSDVDLVIGLIEARLNADADRQSLVNPVISREILAQSLARTNDWAWVADDHGRLTGHLYGALLESNEYGRGIWIGPDGASFDDSDTLADLYRVAGAAWIARGALEHYVWTLDHPDSTEPWYELGFARMHMRGVLALQNDLTHPLPDGYEVRRGGADDIELAVELDDELDVAQQLGPSFSLGLDRSSKREDLLETLEDPEVHYYVVERDGEGVAQCITFPLPTMRGSFKDTLHLSAVTVRGEYRGRGIATAMVDFALNDARAAGFAHAETNWRVTNRQASRYWVRYGFTPTYVRLHRTIGSF
jgi:ribosomal protein S18 acetylase RimI-like enzyme